jgi:hypothetical protein
MFFIFFVRSVRGKGVVDSGRSMAWRRRRIADSRIASAGQTANLPELTLCSKFDQISHSGQFGLNRICNPIMGRRFLHSAGASVEMTMCARLNRRSGTGSAVQAALCVYNVGMEDAPVIVRPARLGRALKKGFEAAYEHLGFVALVSFVSAIGAAGLMGLGWMVGGALHPSMLRVVMLLPGLLFYWLCAVGVFYYANKAVYHEQPTLGDVWRGIVKLSGPAVWLFAINLVVMVVLLGDAVFFVSLKAKGLGIVVGVVCLYLAAAWAVAAIYHLPLLPAQLKMESGPRPAVIIRKSFLLALGSPGFTVGLAFAIITLAVLCALPAGLGTAILFSGAAAFLLTHGLRELFVRYGVVEEEPEVVEDEGWPKG